SGAAGSERGFAYHYAAYTMGVASGSALVGVVVAVLRAIGTGQSDAIRSSYSLGLVAMLLAMALWRPTGRAGDRSARAPNRLRPRTTPHAVAMQLPDLLLVSALAMMLPLAPLVLLRQFHLTPFVVGLAIAGVQAGK